VRGVAQSDKKKERRAMTRESRLGRWLAVGATLAVLGWAAEAQAAKVIFYQTGEDIFEAGPMPAPFDKMPQLAGVKAGFKCKIFGIFWAYLHIWSCEPVAFRGDTFDRNPELVAAVKKTYKEGDMKVGLWKKHGRWLFALIIVGIIVGAVAGRKKKKEE
jgi:hypothetical protein